MNSDVLDLIFALVLLFYAVVGFRQGFVASVLSAIGFLGFGLAGIWLLPRVFEQWQPPAGSAWMLALLSIALVFVLALVGQLIGSALGSGVRERTSGGVRVVDSIFGVGALVVMSALAIWLGSGMIRPVAPVQLSSAIGTSRVVHAVDAVVPVSTDQLTGRLSSLLNSAGFPRVFDGIGAEPIHPTQPPDPDVAQTPGLQQARGSIIRISGDAQECRQSQTGSGWVVRPGQVVTNAHVVAGLREVRLQIGGDGQTYTGRTVLFNPELDLAIVEVPDLPAPPLPLGEPLASGDPAVVAGFPLGGGYHESSARVRAQLTAVGSDIYGNRGVPRQIYSLYTQVEHGNSGGPMLDPDGRVVGVVFAKSLDDSATGYALTLDAVTPSLQATEGPVQPVPTGSCRVR